MRRVRHEITSHDGMSFFLNIAETIDLIAVLCSSSNAVGIATAYIMHRGGHFAHVKYRSYGMTVCGLARL